MKCRTSEEKNFEEEKGNDMSGQSKRLTFVVTPEIEAQMKAMKREVYFDRTQSDMIRELVAAGVRSCKAGDKHAGAERKNA